MGLVKESSAATADTLQGVAADPGQGAAEVPLQQTGPPNEAPPTTTIPSQTASAAQPENEEEGWKPILPIGARVIVRADRFGGDRSAVVLDYDISNSDDRIKLAMPGNPERYRVTPDHYIVRTRDSRSEVLYAAPEETFALSNVDGWSRGEAPERLPNEVVPQESA